MRSAIADADVEFLTVASEVESCLMRKSETAAAQVKRRIIKTAKSAKQPGKTKARERHEDALGQLRKDAFLLKTTVPALTRDFKDKADTLVLRLNNFGQRRRTVKSSRKPQAQGKPLGTHTKLLHIARSHGKAVRSRKTRNIVTALIIAVTLGFGGYFSAGYAYKGFQMAQSYVGQQVPWRDWLATVSTAKNPSVRSDTTLTDNKMRSTGKKSTLRSAKEVKPRAAVKKSEQPKTVHKMAAVQKKAGKGARDKKRP